MAADAPASPTATDDPQSNPATQTETGLTEEQVAGRLLALQGRTAALVAIAALVAFLVPFPQMIYYGALMVLFLAIGFARYGLERSGLYRWWHDYLITAVDFALLAFTLLYPNPLAPSDDTPLNIGNFAYFYVMLAGLAFGYQPHRVLWGGLMGAFFWALGLAWIGWQPRGVAVVITFPSVVETSIVFLIVAVLMAVIVARSQRLVDRQVKAERERSHLARYFPPATVERLTSEDNPLSQMREQNAAVMFFDLVGFTRWAERHGPAEVITMLRDVHDRVESAVFAHEGTLDKYIGDGAMATFGTPDPGPRDATNALACVAAIALDFEAWNDERRRAGLEPVLISLGLHYGPVVVGNIGSARRLEFAVLGDTVNVASRLEELTRAIDCRVAVSGSVVDAASDEAGGDTATVPTGFSEAGKWELRGRDGAIDVLTYG